MREKRVRLLEDGRLRQIGASAALQDGAQLLLPKTAVAEWQVSKTSPMKGDRWPLSVVSYRHESCPAAVSTLAFNQDVVCHVLSRC